MTSPALSTRRSSYNLIGQGGSGGLVTLVGQHRRRHQTQLGLSSLGNYGGPTQTISLGADSLALDAGSDSIAGRHVPTIDQRGALRGPSGSMPDQRSISAPTKPARLIWYRLSPITVVGSLRRRSAGPISAPTPTRLKR